MSDSSSSIPAGWYPDPADPSGLRYWDGIQWTEQRAAAAPAAPAAPEPPAAPTEATPEVAPPAHDPGWGTIPPIDTGAGIPPAPPAPPGPPAPYVAPYGGGYPPVPPPPPFAAAYAGPADPFAEPGGDRYVGFGRAISLAFKQYVGFKGRASRSEFWWFVLFATLVQGIPQAIGYGLSYRHGIGGASDCVAIGISSTCGPVPPAASALIGISSLIGLALLLPYLAVGARRLHDTGKSAWWLLLILLIPCTCFITGIVLIVFFVLDTSPMPNQWGAPPLHGKARR